MKKKHNQQKIRAQEYRDCGIYFLLVGICMWLAAMAARGLHQTAEGRIPGDCMMTTDYFLDPALVYLAERWKYLAWSGALAVIALISAGYGWWLEKRSAEKTWFYYAATGAGALGAVWMWVSEVYLYRTGSAVGAECPLLVAAVLIMLCGTAVRSPGILCMGGLLFVVPVGIWLSVLYMGTYGTNIYVTYSQRHEAMKVYGIMEKWVRYILPAAGTLITAVWCFVRWGIGTRQNARYETVDDSSCRKPVNRVDMVRFLWIAAACFAAQPVLHWVLRWILHGGAQVEHLISKDMDKEIMWMRIIRTGGYTVLTLAALGFQTHGRRVFRWIAAMSAAFAAGEWLAWWYHANLFYGPSEFAASHITSGYNMIYVLFGVCFAAAVCTLFGAEVRRKDVLLAGGLYILAAGGMMHWGLELFAKWIKTVRPGIYTVQTMRQAVLVPLTVTEYVLPAVGLAALAGWLKNAKAR